MIFEWIQRVDRVRAVAERGLVIALTAAIAGIMTVQVVMRYYFSAPIFWAEEVSVQLLVFATLFSLSLLVQQGQLVSIDLLPRALPERARHGLMVVLGGVILALLVLVAWLGWDRVNRPAVRMELGATTQLPRRYNFSVLPLAFAVMAWHQFAAIVRDLRALGGAPARSHPSSSSACSSRACRSQARFSCRPPPSCSPATSGCCTTRSRSSSTGRWRSTACLVTPPVGPGLYIAMVQADIRMGPLFRATIPLLAMVLVVIAAVPALSTWLPAVSAGG